MADNKKNNNKDKKEGTGFKIQSWLYLTLFIVLGYILLKDGNSGLTGKASYSDFENYMEKGYVSSIKVYTNLGNMEVFIIPDSAKYIFPDVALQPL
ncbi:MAG TPA: ATP-dependent metallopeptidase FtsH/Yme1/Tma family protein, partial [Bacteroidaceae bacterium]|nr:ATP-dependent metallopeptidase FtsH/Yme1/Tma family protein [Bacteroidaceae bacterium]